MARRGMVLTFVLFLHWLLGVRAWAGDPPRLMRSPTLNRTHIVFALGGHLWSVPRSGGEARPLTSGEGVEADPHFSPDGTRIAYTGVADDSREVYVIPAEG